MFTVLELIGAKEVLEVVNNVAKFGTEVAKVWGMRYEEKLRKSEKTPELPAEIKDEVEQLTMQYFKERKPPVYMSGVIFSFQKKLDDATKNTLRKFLQVVDWDSDSCSEDELTIYNFTGEYMGGERDEEISDFGFEENTLYLNFAQQDEDKPYNEAALREFADALNRLLPDGNAINNFVTFQ